MKEKSSKECPQCGAGRLKEWNELNEEEQMIAQRLPGSAVYDLSERQARHRWCTKCWHEETAGKHEA